MIQLDYSLKTIEERKAFVDQVLAQEPEPSSQLLEALGNYLILSTNPKADKQILTKNRMVTINKHETSFEGLSAKFENGEDGVYSLAANGRAAAIKRKTKITDEDIKEIPELQPIREAIKFWEEQVEKTEGREKYIARQSLIEFRKEQYIIKAGRTGNLWGSSMTTTTKPYVPEDKFEFNGRTWVDEDGNIQTEGVSLCDPKVCGAILCTYSELETSSNADTKQLLEEFDKVRDEALEPYPILKRIVEYKIADKYNIDIQKALLEEFGTTHSLEYISSLWRKKIPQLIADKAQDKFLDWYYLEVEKGKWKRCSCCGKVKLANNRYFSKNNTSKDSFYSICKECRNKKNKMKKEAQQDGQ